MNYRTLGKTGLQVSTLSYGASALGSVHHEIDEADGLRAVHCAVKLGINYIDVSPFYGLTVAETLLGKVLKEIPRDTYYLSTKAGRYGFEEFDYSSEHITKSVEESMKRLHVDYFDILLLHDIEYQGRRFMPQALNEGIPTLQKLKEHGKIRFYGFSAYPIDVFHQTLEQVDVDVILNHNHYCLNDTLLLDLLPLLREKNIGLINASPLACGLLTKRGAADWHPATNEDKSVIQRAIEFCEQHGTSLEKLAIQFATSNEDIPTTLVSTASSDRIAKNAAWAEEVPDEQMVMKVQEILQPIFNKDYNFGG